jgi:hypothetical protein
MTIPVSIYCFIMLARSINILFFDVLLDIGLRLQNVGSLGIVQRSGQEIQLPLAFGW